jgi:phosphoglycolate phosphatase
MAAMKIKGVLFDKDGTLIDVTGTWVPAYREILDELFPGCAEEKLIAAGYDRQLGKFRAGSILAGGTTRDLVEVWWPGLSVAETEDKIRLLDVGYRGVAQKHLKGLMPLEPVLSPLRQRGMKLGVATNDSERSARHHLEEIGVAHFFDAIIGADSVARPKPAGDMIALFASRAALAPEQIAMVGDNPHDIETARNGGAGLAIGVLTGNADRHDIAHLADHVVASVADLPALLATL